MQTMKMDNKQSWCVRVGNVRSRRHCHLDIPEINTYSQQMIDCSTMYGRLLEKYPLRKLQNATTPISHRHTNQHSSNAGLRSAPPFCFRQRESTRLTSSSSTVMNGRDSNASTTRESRPSTQGHTQNIDPIRLTNYLKSRGCGTPTLVTSSHFVENDKTLPAGVRARILPKNPSLREKFKGRARLDYEMANIKAEAFCEQEKGRYFRTASANLRNRDIRFQEEEMREQMRREQEVELKDDDDDDDILSIAASPLEKEELFFRIEVWLREVETALGGSASM